MNTEQKYIFLGVILFFGIWGINLLSIPYMIQLIEFIGDDVTIEFTLLGGIILSFISAIPFVLFWFYSLWHPMTQSHKSNGDVKHG